MSNTEFWYFLTHRYKKAHAENDIVMKSFIVLLVRLSQHPSQNKFISRHRNKKDKIP